MLNILREWFAANRPLILFAYGQVFFILGLAIALQSGRKRSRLILARSLPWLAGFGFLHGLNEWGDLFIPIQEQFLSTPIAELLSALQLILLAVSFFLLFQFGMNLTRPFLPPRPELRWLPFSVFLVWLALPFWGGLMLTHDLVEWHNRANALARYMLCLPGGLLSGYALLKQARLEIRPLGLKSIESMFHAASGALGVYAVLGGLIVPPLSMFPASVVNTETFNAWFIFPPAIFRSLAGLILAVSIIRAIQVFDVEMERLVLRMEEEQVIFLEHERMARDLHDGALQQVYAAGLIAQSLQKKMSGTLAVDMERLVMSINHSIEQLRAFLSQGQENIENVGLIPALENILQETRRIIPVVTHWETPQPLALSPEQVSHLMAFVREALSNAIRHAQTEFIEVELKRCDNFLCLTIKDFGAGVALDYQPGYGLRNMRDRARLLGAELIFESAPKKGVMVRLKMPMEDSV